MKFYERANENKKKKQNKIMGDRKNNQTNYIANILQKEIKD